MKLRITSFCQLKHDYDDNYREFLTSSVCNETWRSLALTRGHLTNAIGKSFSPPKIQVTSGSWWRSFTDGGCKRRSDVSKRTAKPFEDTMTSSKRAEFTWFRAKHTHHTCQQYLHSEIHKITKRWKYNIPDSVQWIVFEVSFMFL